MPAFKGTSMKPVPGRNPCVITYKLMLGRRQFTNRTVACRCRFGEIPGFPSRFQVGWKKRAVRRRSSCTPFKWDTWPCRGRRFFCCTVSCHPSYSARTFQYSYQRTRSGGYEDDLDLGYELCVYLFNAFNSLLIYYSSTYTGQGGPF